MVVNRQGNLKYPQTVLVQQATRARAILETYLMKHKHMPVDIVFELFDTCIKPILLYACEIIIIICIHTLGIHIELQ